MYFRCGFVMYKSVITPTNWKSFRSSRPTMGKLTLTLFDGDSLTGELENEM